jgi:hypothetical protein
MQSGNTSKLKSSVGDLASSAFHLRPQGYAVFSADLIKTPIDRVNGENLTLTKKAMQESHARHLNKLIHQRPRRKDLF